MHVTAFPLDGESDEADCHQVICAALTHDLPGDPHPAPADVTGWLRVPLPGSRIRLWSARDEAGRLLGLAHLHTSDRFHPHSGTVGITVHPDARRSGVGSALLRRATGALVADGRRTVVAQPLEGTGGTQFAVAHGMVETVHNARTLLDLGSLDQRLLDKLADEEHPSFRLAAWVGAAPEDLLPSYAAAKRATRDAPRGTMEFEYPVFDSGAIREYEEWTARRGREFRVVVAVHEPTGEVAGLTELAISQWTPQRAAQEDTAVLPAYRGSGLGLWMKAEMLRWLRADRADVAEICAANAEDDVHLRRINDRLGFRFDRWAIDYQGAVAALAARFRATRN